MRSQKRVLVCRTSLCPGHAGASGPKEGPPKKTLKEEERQTSGKKRPAAGVGELVVVSEFRIAV